ncbi:MAG: hypothetical protein ACK2U1_17645 [Anaerolineales bacterium]
MSMLSASFLLLLAYGLGEYWLGALAAAGLGLWGWYDLKKRKWVWGVDIFLVVAVLLVTVGAILELRLYLLLPALLFTLVFWDIARFQIRMADAPASQKLVDIERRHLSILGMVIAVGGVVAFVTLAFQVQLSFAVILILGVVLVISLGQIYRLLRS